MCIPLGWNMYTHWPAQTFLYDRSKLHRGTFLQQINLPLYKKRLFCQMQIQSAWLKTSLNLEKPKYYLQIIICVHFNLLELLDEWESPREVRYSKLSITEKHVMLTFRNFSVIVFWDLLLVPFLEKSTFMTQDPGPAQELARHTLYLTLRSAMADRETTWHSVVQL